MAGVFPNLYDLARMSCMIYSSVCFLGWICTVYTVGEELDDLQYQIMIC